jgi:hypothetical protein
MAKLSASLYKYIDLGNEGVRRLAGSKCALLGRLRLTVD